MLSVGYSSASLVVCSATYSLRLSRYYPNPNNTCFVNNNDNDDKYHSCLLHLHIAWLFRSHSTNQLKSGNLQREQAMPCRPCHLRNNQLALCPLRTLKNKSRMVISKVGYDNRHSEGVACICKGICIAISLHCLGIDQHDWLEILSLETTRG